MHNGMVNDNNVMFPGAGKGAIVAYCFTITFGLGAPKHTILGRDTFSSWMCCKSGSLPPTRYRTNPSSRTRLMTGMKADFSHINMVSGPITLERFHG